MPERRNLQRPHVRHQVTTIISQSWLVLSNRLMVIGSIERWSFLLLQVFQIKMCSSTMLADFGSFSFSSN